MKNYTWELADDGTLDTVIKITIYLKNGGVRTAGLRLQEVDRDSSGKLTEEGEDYIEEAVAGEVEECIQAWNEDAQEQRLGL